MDKCVEIKQMIASEQYEYISFDIFDTIFMRPFYRPTDLFYLLDSKFEEFSKANISFHKIRVDGETCARKFYELEKPHYEDIKLVEIYDYINELFGIEKFVCNEMMKLEIELEKKFITVRESVKILYEYAKKMGKKILFISDMYMNIENIEMLLHLHGFSMYEKIFLSSEERLLKKTGNLYNAVLSYLNVPASKILHIGDNLKSDIIKAEEKGFSTFYYPKALDVYENKYQDTLTNYCSKMGMMGAYPVANYSYIKNSLGYGVMVAMVANKYFDNPFRDFKSETDFNEDPFFMGYYILGMHLLGILRWIFHQIKEKNIKKIFFLSRDGWLIYKAYNISKKFLQYLPNSDYLYTSREAMLPIQIKEELDFFDLPIEFWKYTPKTLSKLLSFCTKELKENELKKIIIENNFEYNSYFTTVNKYHLFINFFLHKLYDKEKHINSVNIITEYFMDVKQEDIFFDMGYSGRIHESICRATRKKLYVLYIHMDGMKSDIMSRKGSFTINNFYDYTPSITGMLREYLLSENGPSCTGYCKVGTEVIPEFENNYKNNNKDIINLIQNGALEFVLDYFEKFHEYIAYLPFKSTEVSFPFEGFLREISEKDRSIFNEEFLGDKIYGQNSQINISKFWINRKKEIKSFYEKIYDI